VDLSRIPIWIAYVASPVLLLIFGGKVIVNSEDPLPVTAIVIACGLFCAAVLHGYVSLRRRLTRDKREVNSKLPASKILTGIGAFFLLMGLLNSIKGPADSPATSNWRTALYALGGGSFLVSLVVGYFERRKSDGGK